MKMKIMLACVFFVAPYLASAATEPLAKEGVQVIIKAYTSSIVATYACRTTLDGGNGQYHQALSLAVEAFTRATGDREKAKMMIEVLEKRVENEDPGAQLMHQFDEVKASPQLRQRSCEQMVEGTAQRAIQASDKYNPQHK